MLVITLERRVRVAALLTFSTVLTTTAFLRGNYLLGVAGGLTYAVVTACLVWLFARYLTHAGRPSPLRVIALFALSLPLILVLAYPTSVSPDLQHFIDKQATDRAARRELAVVFSSDPSYGDLSVSTTHLKVVNVAIRGTLASRTDLSQLRGLIATECPSLEQCVLRWDVRLLQSGERLDALDRDIERGR